VDLSQAILKQIRTRLSAQARRYRLARFVFGALLLLSIAFLIWNFRERSKGVLSQPIQRGTVFESVYGIGTVLANRSYQIKLGVVSTIDALFVKEGDTVKKGDRLLEIEKVVYRAPFNGTITYLPYKVGENIFAQVPVLTLVNLMDRYLVVSLEQQGALHVRPGQKARMSFDTIRQQAYEGVVQSIYPTENGFLARMDVSTLPSAILPGMTADVAIEIQRHDHALVIPVASLMGGNSVWVKRGHGIPKKVDVQVGIIDQAQAEVVAGDLRPGDRVLIKNRELP
jgi:multidrug efflux pump subunit AcrA (membrane-fusion protein)